MSGNGANKQPILEIDLNVALCGLDISFEQFVDLCILCGCDYCSSIKGIGPKTALKLIRQYKTLEGVVQFVKRDTKKKYQLPKDWTSYRLKPESPEALPIQDTDSQIGDGDSHVTPIPNENKDPIVCTDESVVLLGAPKDPQDAIVLPGAPKDSQDANDAVDDDEDEPCLLQDTDDEVVAEEDDIDLVDILSDAEEEETDSQPRETDQDDEGELVEPMFKRARELFFNHEVISATEVELKWLPPQEEELRRFLVERMGFNAERVETGIKKLVEAQGKKAQQRLDR